ncbi:MAG: LysM peptidoglycan-binding domain-containing protein [Chloroflexi bacterium]|nr:LysM peptidoglycan-binding domain-containing protein [Chloroflexota bacterium]
MIKMSRSLTSLFAVVALIVSACTRFIGTPPAPAATQTPGAAAPAATRSSSEQPTATAPVLPPEGRRATVSEIVNVVEAKTFADAAFQPVSDGTVISAGGQVRTGVNSRARIDLSEGAVVRLAADTVFTLEALTESGGGPFALVSIELGKIWVSLTGGSLQVVTPVGSASVRGSFAIFQYIPGNPDDPSDDTLILDCIEGLCSAQSGAIDEQAGNLERIVLGNGGQVVARVTLTGEDAQNFILNNPEVGEAIVATLTAAAPAPQAAAPTETSAPAAQATPSPTVAAPPATPVPIIGQHLLIGGETLFCIGRAYGVLPGAIAEANGLGPESFVYPGQVLVIPAAQWFNIPDGPVCNPQFDSPYPGLPVTTPVPTGASANAATSTATPAPTDTPNPVASRRSFSIHSSIAVACPMRPSSINRQTPARP